LISSSRTTGRTSGARAAAAAAVVAAFLLAAPALLAGAPAAASARDWPEPRGHLSDFAGIVDPESADSIEALATELRAKTGAELAVVTVPDLGGADIDGAAVELFSRWGVGRSGRDDGVLVLLARDERRIRIEVGYGLEGILPDGLCGSIIRRVMGPDLAADRFGRGLWRGADAIAGVIARDRGAELAPGRGAPLPAQGRRGGQGVAVLLLVFFLIVMIAVILNRSTPGWGGWSSGRRYRGPHWGGGFGGYGGGFGGWGGGGFGGGGFGGFGGGRSGGGGASGRF
jgi:uncharacterized protein